MIYIFRKEMKKWHTVLWIVFVSLALSGVSLVVFRQKSPSELSLATVNGKPVYFDQFKLSLADIQSRINALRPLAQAYGMSEELFLSTFLGSSRPEEIALDACVKQKLIDNVKDRFSLSIDDEWFKSELLKTLPQLTDAQGNVNMDVYQRYLERLSTTPAEYEERRREDFKRDVVQQLIAGSDYIPHFIIKDLYALENLEKSFSIVRFSRDIFVNQVKENALDENQLELYYQDHKEAYRIGEKKKSVYWALHVADYTKTIEIDPIIIKDFYEKHKSSLFRIAPQIKVRHIFIPASEKDAFEVAKEVHQKAIQTPNSFQSLVKQYSKDEKSVKSGGLTELFSKGTYDAEFEKSAFRLRNEGEISGIVKTKDGYEIIQLVQRVAASEKPFDSVKSDIEQTLKAKRSQAAVRADLEALVRSCREDETALEQFAQKHKLDKKETSWIAEHDTHEANVQAELAKRLFSRQKQSTLGYFLNGDDYIIYKLIDTEKSYVPKLSEIKDTIVKAYYDDKATLLARNTIKNLRLDIFAKKISLEEIAKQYKTSLIVTKKITKGESISELSHDGSLAEKLINLTDQSQVMEYVFKDKFYLAQIHEITPINSDLLQKEKAKIIKQEKFKSKSLVQGAFIASLHRNAKIDVDYTLLRGINTDMKD